VIIFALLERGQIAARNRQKLAAQRLGAGAVADLLEPGDRHGAGAFHRLQRQSAIADLDHFVAAHAFGALRKQLQPDLAANAVGTGNGSEGDPVVAGSAGRTCPWQLRPDIVSEAKLPGQVRPALPATTGSPSLPLPVPTALAARCG
jgi:hypothetical protein